MSDWVIRVEGLSKRYRIGPRESYLALRDVLSRWLKAPLSRMSEPEKPAGGPGHLWALQDVSFEIQQGQVVGLIGRNGAGKTTLLKVLSRITYPTAGVAELRGRVGSLLEVGTGFHPELTGRENIFFSGAILGMRKKEIEKKFDEIAAFAEVETFLDTPLKHYSDGMKTRLGFAVAAHLEPEILLVDEVLAVGDLEFQKKCLGKMNDVARGGRTVLFVSHQMNQIRRLCTQVGWLDGGRLRSLGPAAEVIGLYEASLRGGELQEAAAEARPATGARFLGWEVVGARHEKPNIFSTNGPLAIRFRLEIHEAIHRGVHGVALFDNEGQLLWGWAARDLRLSPGRHEFSYRFPVFPLRPGLYHWQVSLYEEEQALDVWACRPPLIIATENHQHYLDEWNGMLNLPFSFSVEAGC